MIQKIKTYVYRVFRQGELLHRTIAFIAGLAFVIAAGLSVGLYLYKKPATHQDFLHIAQTVAYALGLFTASAAAAIAYRAQRLKEVDATNKRFKEAVKSLRDGDVFVRVEGIFALKRLASNAPNDEERQRATDLLCGFLRENLKYVPPKGDEKYKPLEKGIDHEAALDSLKRLREKHGDLYINLEHTDLAGMNFDFACFFNVNLFCANLENALFMSANLTGTVLSYAILTRAWLSDANLTDAWLVGADLVDAGLKGANLTGAMLYGANLDNAFIDDCSILPNEVLEKYEIVKSRLCRKVDEAAEDIV